LRKRELRRKLLEEINNLGSLLEGICKEINLNLENNSHDDK
jgi:hypothetical protein